MINQELLDYIKQQQSQGIDRGTIEKTLLTSGGWAAADISKAFATIDNPNVPQNAVALNYAGFWIRVAAQFIDSILIGLVMTAIEFIIPSVTNGNSWAAYVIQILITWAYFVWMTNNNGATVGKMTMGIKVLTVNGEKPTLGKVMLRETVGKALSVITLGIGYIICAFTEKKQALHDFIASTIVVYSRNSK